MTAYDCQMRHLNLSVVDDRHFADLLLIARIHLLNAQNESSVDLFYDLINSGKQTGEQLDRPFFQRFGHDRMIGVCAGLAGDFPCFVPGQIIVIHQDTHQLCYCNGRMGII